MIAFSVSALKWNLLKKTEYEIYLVSEYGFLPEDPHGILPSIPFFASTSEWDQLCVGFLLHSWSSASDASVDFILLVYIRMRSTWYWYLCHFELGICLRFFWLLDLGPFAVPCMWLIATDSGVCPTSVVNDDELRLSFKHCTDWSEVSLGDDDEFRLSFRICIRRQLDLNCRHAIICVWTSSFSVDSVLPSGQQRSVHLRSLELHIESRLLYLVSCFALCSSLGSSSLFLCLATIRVMCFVWVPSRGQIERSSVDLDRCRFSFSCAGVWAPRPYFCLALIHVLLSSYA